MFVRRLAKTLVEGEGSEVVVVGLGFRMQRFVLP